jgi:hypothetical protein
MHGDRSCLARARRNLLPLIVLRAAASCESCAALTGGFPNRKPVVSYAVTATYEPRRSSVVPMRVRASYRGESENRRTEAETDPRRGTGRARYARNCERV